MKGRPGDDVAHESQLQGGQSAEQSRDNVMSHLSDRIRDSGGRESGAANLRMRHGVKIGARSSGNTECYNQYAHTCKLLYKRVTF